MAYTTVKNSKKRTFTKFDEGKDAKEAYSTAKFTLEEKQQILDQLGQPDLIELFKDWKPRSTRKRPTAPLDQRVSITLTQAEKTTLDNEIKQLKQTSKGVSGSQLIRSRALSTVDINGWKNIAIKALNKLDEIDSQSNKLRRRKKEILADMEEVDNDSDERFILDKELAKINDDLNQVIAQNVRRNVRLAGRMSLAEAETMKWRAQRLCISSSDYMRMMVFGYEPDSIADAHFSLDSKKRFYVSIVDVASNGWGNPPNLVHCNQCSLYLEEIDRLNDRLKQYETFGKK